MIDMYSVSCHVNISYWRDSLADYLVHALSSIKHALRLQTDNLKEKVNYLWGHTFVLDLKHKLHIHPESP